MASDSSFLRPTILFVKSGFTNKAFSPVACHHHQSSRTQAGWISYIPDEHEQLDAQIAPARDEQIFHLGAHSPLAETRCVSLGDLQEGA